MNSNNIHVAWSAQPQIVVLPYLMQMRIAAAMLDPLLQESVPT